MHCVTSRLPIVRSLTHVIHSAQIYNGLKTLEERTATNQADYGNVYPSKTLGTTQQRSYKTTCSFNDKEKFEGMYVSKYGPVLERHYRRYFPLFYIPMSFQISDKDGKKRVKLKKKSSYPRVYTRTGDGGNSSLFTGERRPKSDMVFSALGTTDELSSHLGLAREFACESSKPCHPYVDQLQRIQCLLQGMYFKYK